MSSLVRELVQKGFAESERDALTGRIALVLAICDLGDEASRLKEAQSLSLTLLEIQRDYRPSGNLDPKRTLTIDEERRIRIMAEALARDLRRRLDPAYEAPGSPRLREKRNSAAASKTPPGYEFVEWKTLAGFEYFQGMSLPEEVRRLHGRKVAVVGHMLTLDEIENIKRFVIVEEAFFYGCGIPEAHRMVEITIDGTRGVEYLNPPILIWGVLEVGEKIEYDEGVDENFVSSVYRLKVESPAHVIAIE